MKVVFVEIFFDEIDHFHPNFDESVPNRARHPDRHQGQRVRVILGKSSFPSTGVGFQACDHHPEHRVIREEVGG